MYNKSNRISNVTRKLDNRFKVACECDCELSLSNYFGSCFSFIPNYILDTFAFTLRRTTFKNYYHYINFFRPFPCSRFGLFDCVESKLVQFSNQTIVAWSDLTSTQPNKQKNKKQKIRITELIQLSRIAFCRKLIFWKLHFSAIDIEIIINRWIIMRKREHVDNEKEREREAERLGVDIENHYKFKFKKDTMQCMGFALGLYVQLFQGRVELHRKCKHVHFY